MLQTSFLLMKSLSKTGTPISVVCPLFPKGTFQIFILTYCSWRLVSCGGGRPSPVIHHSAEYMFIFFVVFLKIEFCSCIC